MQSSELMRGEMAEERKRLPYTAPAIVYEGQIETRAGSLSSGLEGEKDASTGFDPADLFGVDG